MKQPSKGEEEHSRCREGKGQDMFQESARSWNTGGQGAGDDTGEMGRDRS